MEVLKNAPKIRPIYQQELQWDTNSDFDDYDCVLNLNSDGDT
jgi:hypothetical protein